MMEEEELTYDVRLETGNLAYTALVTLSRACGLLPCDIYLILP